MFILGMVLIMIVVMEVMDFCKEKMAARERKAVFQSFYEVDKSLKYLK